ncbi:DUF2570 domain-containing protein [Kosakonia sp. YIM B13605]|uniref:DUF2570 domain-containing protein n=1 Tax=unclassified Kosakonia TaxID=2632876 RepID=UPI003673F403
MFDIKAPSASEIVIIAGVVTVIFLGVRVSSNYQSLVKDNATLTEQTAQLSSKNDMLVKSVDNLTQQFKAMNDIVANETRRRAAAEMKIQQLQKEAIDALKNDPCAREPVPDVVTDRLREAADSVRAGKTTPAANSGKSAN